MGLTTSSWVVLLLLAVASATSSNDSHSVSREEPEQTTENAPPTSSASNDKSTSTNNTLPDRIQSVKLRQHDANDLAPATDVTMDDLLFFESLINGEKVMDETQKKTASSRNLKNEKSNKIDNNSEDPVESKINTDIRRQGELKPKIKPGKSGPDIQFDDSRQGLSGDSPPRFGLRKSKLRAQDEAPVLQLTQGGYSRPFRQPRFRNRYVSRPDSSEQSTQVQVPDQNPNENRAPETRRVVPQVTYSSPPQQLQNFGPRPIANSPFEAPRNMLAIHHVMPTTLQNSFFNTPPTGLPEYTTVPFQAQFPQGNEVGGFPNFGRDSNNAALYQVPQRNPFQTPAVMFQSAPEVQTQPMLVNPAGNVPPQFQTNPFTPYPGFENAEENSRPNYEMYFRNPTVNRQFQIPSNFYAAAPNTVNAFNSPPISFLSNYPSSDDRLTSRFFRYPVTTEAQNNRQNPNDQQLESDASQEDKKTKADEQETTPTSRDDTSTVSFGTRLQAQNEADVYMRYPTNEAGYATQENLPSQNNSGEGKDSSQETNSGQRTFPIDDPFRNGLNSIHSNQRINNSYEFPPEIFRNAPLDFGYQRPQSQIFLQYPGRNREAPRYPSPNFGSRGPFEQIAPLPENNYQFLNMENQRQLHRDIDATPACAKQKNVSICFEDSEYPRNDILYSLNSNSFLADRLSGQEVPLNSVVLVERNATMDSDHASEEYACAVETKYGSPLRAKNLAGAWRVIVNIPDKFSQPVRMEVCKSLGDACSYVDSRTKTTCVQKYSLQRLLSWNPGRGIYSDVYKVPVACSCQILKTVET